MDDVRLVEDEVDRGQIGRPARVGALDLLEIPDAHAENRMVVRDLPRDCPQVGAAASAPRGEMRHSAGHFRWRDEDEIHRSERCEGEQGGEHARP